MWFTTMQTTLVRRLEVRVKCCRIRCCLDADSLSYDSLDLAADRLAESLRGARRRFHS